LKYHVAYTTTDGKAPTQLGIHSAEVTMTEPLNSAGILKRVRLALLDKHGVADLVIINWIPLHD
jgi:hypothetical protein